MMLAKLSSYENLGTPGYFWRLFKALDETDTWTLDDITAYFFNKMIDGRSVFDGCVPLLLATQVLRVNQSGLVEVGDNYKAMANMQECKHKLVERLLSSFKKDTAFIEIFISGSVSYDLLHGTINIRYSAFRPKYSNLRRLLIDFDFLQPHISFPSNTLIINPYWRNLFEKLLSTKVRRRVLPEDIKAAQLQQEINGEIAERFVLRFEKLRLNGKDGIQWIAPYDAGAGFDIYSFEHQSSTRNNRYIEVKGYVGESPYFYWTRNEIKKAERSSENYYLYLVDRDRIQDLNYKPKIIQNPVKNVLRSSKWQKVVEKYYITVY